jgi:hypothetical protein
MLIDLDDWLLLLSSGIGGARANDGGYVCALLDGKLHQLHKLLMPSTGGIDHINHDGMDNRRSNLRKANQSVNNMNKSMRQDNSSGTMGVYRRRRKVGYRYIAEIKKAGKMINLGSFTDKQDAIAARKAAEVKYGFHPNHGKTREEIAQQSN